MRDKRLSQIVEKNTQQKLELDEKIYQNNKRLRAQNHHDLQDILFKQ